jgi:hypothetical protein
MFRGSRNAFALVNVRNCPAVRFLALLACVSVGCSSAPEDVRPASDAETIADQGVLDSAADVAVADANVETSADASFRPEPVPDVSPEPPAPCAAAKAGGDHYQFLDDVCHAKRWPKDVDRDFACPIVATSATGFHPAGEVVIEDVLGDVVPSELRVTVIVIRRVGGVPHYRYLSNGTSSDVFQPWSSTKWLAVANAATTLRAKSSLAVGLESTVDGDVVGDLITTIANYDETHYTSNSLARWFHDVGGRAKANAMIHDGWLGRPAAETFGGNYGEPSAPLGFTFVADAGSVTVTPDATSGPANALSTRTLAEAMKRTVLHREEASTRLPGIQWGDVRTILAGPKVSKWYASPLGGLTADTAIYLQAAHDLDYLDRRSRGRWRTYSKLGFGNGEFVNVGYACYPVLDPSGAPVPDAGDEVVVAARLASGGASEAERDRILAKAYRSIFVRLLTRKL